MFVLGHLSDLHVTGVRVPARRVAALLGKRGPGWVSWRLRRRFEYRPEVFAALLADIREQRPQHIAITGDLTNLGLPEEFPDAARRLEQLGDSRLVSLIPGNHDAYVSLPYARSWAHWEPYMRSDPAWAEPAAPGWRSRAQLGADPTEVGFPSVRIRGPIALIGLCSANPTPIFRATGTVGARQLAALARILAKLRGTSLLRVVLVHHPPTDARVAARRRLTDASDLREVLSREGAELVLHGHTHRTSIATLDGPTGPVPVVGVRSASARGRRPGRRAQYHLYRIARAPGSASSSEPLRIALDVRGWEPSTGRFVAESSTTL